MGIGHFHPELRYLQANVLLQNYLNPAPLKKIVKEIYQKFEKKYLNPCEYFAF